MLSSPGHVSAAQEFNKLLITSSEFSQSKETEQTAFWRDNDSLFCLKSSSVQCCAELQGNQLGELTTSLLLNS